MVKGVNKTVIEVNNTGSRMFEKIVLYVTPEYGRLSAKQLRRAANNLLLGFEDFKRVPPLRTRILRKRLVIGISAAVGLLGVLALLVILL